MYTTSLMIAVCSCLAVDLPTDIELSKVVADLEYVLADCCGLGDDADVAVAGSSSAVNKV